MRVQIFQYIRNEFYIHQEVLTPIRRLEAAGSSPRTPIPRTPGNDRQKLGRAVTSRALSFAPVEPASDLDLVLSNDSDSDSDSTLVTVKKDTIQIEEDIQIQKDIQIEEDIQMEEDIQIKEVVKNSNAPKVSNNLEKWKSKIMSCPVSNRSSILEQDLQQNSLIHKLMKSELKLNECVFCGVMYVRVFATKRHMITRACKVLKT